MATFYTGVDKQRYDAGEKFLPMNQFLLNYTAPNLEIGKFPNEGEGEEVTTEFGLPNTNAFVNAGGGGTYYSSDQRINDFNKAIADRQKRLENPGWLQQQINKYTGGQRPVSEMGQVQYNPDFTRSLNKGITSFGLDQPINPDGTFAGQGAFGEMPVVPQLDERLLSKIPLGIGSMVSMGLPDKYYSDFTVPEQALTQLYMGYSDPNTGMANKDPFGINVRSALGNYAEYADKTVDKLNDALAKSAEKRGLTWDANTGTIVGVDEDDPAYQDFMNMTKNMQQRLGYYGNVNQNFNVLKHNYETAKKQRDAWEKETYRELDEADKQFKETGDYDEYSGAGGSLHYDIPASTYTYEGSDEQDKANEGASNTQGYTGAGTSGSYAAGPQKGGGASYGPWSKKDGGRVGLRYGGLLSIL